MFKNYFIGLGIALLVIFTLGILGFATDAIDLASYKFWEPKMENAKRQVFENTQSYIDGKNMDLSNFHHEWVKANKDDKLAIEATIRHQFANFSSDKISDNDLRNFLIDIKNR